MRVLQQLVHDERERGRLLARQAQVVAAHLDLEREARPGHRLRDRLRDALEHLVQATWRSPSAARISCTPAMLRIRLIVSVSTSRPETSRPSRSCSRSSIAIIWRLFFTRWCISRTIADLTTRLAFSIASAVWFASVCSMLISDGVNACRRAV